jgi:hypothetical protein
MRTVLLLFLALYSIQLAAQDAVTLNATYLFYTAEASDSLPARVLATNTGLQVTGVSSETYALDHEDRIFHWFHVTDAQGRAGWVRGYDLATAFTASDAPEHLTATAAPKLSFPRDFGTTQPWIAAVGTVDAQSNDGSTFIEYYLVLSNESGKHLTWPLGMQTTQGKSETIEMYIKDVNSDQKTDFVLLKRSEPEFGSMSYQLEIFTLNQGRFQRLLDQSITVRDAQNDVSPWHAQCVEIASGQIRFEAIVHTDCPTDTKTKHAEHCLTFETSTLIWSREKQQFVVKYEPVRVPLKAIIQANGRAKLQKEPDTWSGVAASVPDQTQVVVHRMFHQYTSLAGKKGRITWFYVELPDGKKGYIPGSSLNWPYARHGGISKQWCGENAPLTTYEFRPIFTFIELP